MVKHTATSVVTIERFIIEQEKIAVRPRVALISVGTDNSYGHPSSDVVRSLAASGAQVLRTDLLGTVVVRTNGRSLTIDAGGEQWAR